MNHFVVMKSVAKGGVMINDPVAGQRFLSLAEASKHLTGVALELSPSGGFLAQDGRTQLPFSTFWGQLDGSTHALLQVLAACRT
jgi:ATP-binding cassette subfamily B protein RaxB